MVDCIVQSVPVGEVSGTFSPSGLNNGGLVTVVAIDNTTWTALPSTALSLRNAVNIQNYSGQEIKINYSSSVVGYVGMRIPNQGERQYAITPGILLYAKSATSAVNIEVEELS